MKRKKNGRYKEKSETENNISKLNMSQKNADYLELDAKAVNNTNCLSNL